MQSVRSQAQHNVANLHILASNDPVAFHHADDKSSKIVFPVRIEARHLGSLPADQRASIVLACVSNAFHHLLRNGGFKFSRGKIVHKEQRRGALYRNIVDAVVHQVRAHGRVQPHLEGDLELRPHAIDA